MRLHEKTEITRRSFLATAAIPLATAAQKSGARSIPIGLELYSVRDDLAKDLNGTVRAVAKMGYQCVEFYAPYFNWTLDQTKDMRKLLDNLGVKCYSTHNDAKAFTREGLPRAIERNHALGSKYVVMASPPKSNTLDGYKAVAETLSRAEEELNKAGLHAGFHNHTPDFRPIDARRPIEIIAADTPPSVMLQLDVGQCLEPGSDPVAWINANPGRIRSMHVKDWSPERGFKVLLGEGVAHWPEIFAAAEKTGGIEFYLIEQEGSEYSEMETAERCLAAFKRIHPAA